MPQKAFLFIGPPTSGKSTQSLFLEETVKGKRIRGKDVVPELVTLEDSRSLVPDTVFLPAFERLLNRQVDPILVSDNLPRTELQAQMVADWGRNTNVEIHVIALDLSKDEIIARAKNRLVCPDCNESYHSEVKPSRTDGICDRDGATLVRRSGDGESIVLRGYEDHLRDDELVVKVLEQAGAHIHRVSVRGTAGDTARRLFSELSPVIFEEPETGREYLQFRDTVERIGADRQIFISGFSVYAYGGRPRLKDLDIAVADTDISKIAQALGGKVVDLDSSVAITRFIERFSGVEPVSNIRVKVDDRMIDFSHDLLKANIQEVRFMGLQCEMMSLEMVMLFKAALGRQGTDDWGQRKSDLDDLENLARVQNVNWGRLFGLARDLQMVERLKLKLFEAGVKLPGEYKDFR